VERDIARAHSVTACLDRPLGNRRYALERQEVGETIAGQNVPVRVESPGTVAAEAIARIREIADSTAAEVSQLLPALDCEILLWVRAGKDVIPETGELGMSLRPGLIEWVVDPDRPGGILDCAEARLRNTLFHELHHQVRGWVMRGGDHSTTFMDAVIAEGLATVFARDEAGDQVPWAEYPPEISQWVAEVQTVNDPRDYGQWMFRHPDGRRWIGYRTGTYICDQAITRSAMTAATLATASTRQILALAGLRPDHREDA
jgi:hypothetical protein